jgi:AcrR family transcriptional regulator
MSAPTRRERNRSEQRERILGAARELFAARGLEQVAMAEVADAAGVARATVFNYFASKHTLVEAITEETFAYYRAMLERALADDRASTPALVRALFEHMGAGIELFHPFYRGVFREIVRIQVGLDEGGAAQRMRESALGLLRALLGRGQERGELVRDHAPEDLAAAFDALSNGTIVHWLYEDTSGSLRERMQRAAEIFLGPVATAPAARGEPLPDLSVSEADVLPVRRVRARARRRRSRAR